MIKADAPSGRVVGAATHVAALSPATCSAAFSISGLTSIFAGAFLPVIGMGAAFELGKLSAVARLGQLHGGRALQLACTALVALLMVLNSIGVYSFLSRAHIEHVLAGDLTVASKAADVDARLTVQAATVADLDRRIGHINQAVEKSIARGNSKSAMALVDQQKSNRANLAAARIKEAKALADLQVQKWAIDGERKSVEADLGPVRYLATLIGGTDEQTMRWFILAVALLLDPTAVLLLLAATHSGAPMSPARTRDDHHDIDLNKLVRQIVLDIGLLGRVAVNGGRGLAVISALVAARRDGPASDALILDFLERHVTER